MTCVDCAGSVAGALVGADASDAVADALTANVNDADASSVDVGGANVPSTDAVADALKANVNDADAFSVDVDDADASTTDVDGANVAQNGLGLASTLSSDAASLSSSTYSWCIAFLIADDDGSLNQCTNQLRSSSRAVHSACYANASSR